MDAIYNYYEIDQGAWPRARHFTRSLKAADPCLTVTAAVNLGKVGRFSRPDVKLFPAFLFSALRAVNAQESLRCRLVDDRVLLFEAVDLNFWVLDEIEEVFYLATAALAPDLDSFARNLENAHRTALAERRLTDERLDVIEVLVLPWLTFTEFRPPAASAETRSIPRLALGRYDQTNGVMPLSLTVHHGLVGPSHLARFIASLEGSDYLMENFVF